MQKKVKEFNTNISKNDPLDPHARLMDALSELGELAKEYLHCTDYGSKRFELEDDFIEEFGDVMYSLLSLACELNIDADEALQIVLDKYRKRIEKKNHMGSEE